MKLLVADKKNLANILWVTTDSKQLFYSRWFVTT
jgi:hypothetical protein